MNENSSDTERRTAEEHNAESSETNRRLVSDGGSDTYKVLGQLSDSNNGIGVLGCNTASTGTTYGVKGEVNSSSGYGLYTPNDAKIDGGIDSTVDLDLRVDGNRALHLGSESGDDAGNVILGNASNTFDGSAVGATISGGGGLNPNRAFADYTTVGGGENNTAGTNDGVETSTTHATVGGGRGNDSTGFASTVGGGNNNDATESNATVAGGFLNVASGFRAAVGGGRANEATATETVVSGGGYNKVTAPLGTIGGGGYTDPNNRDSTSNKVYDEYGTVAGGGNNQAGSDDADPTSDPYATVPGGRDNTASGAYSFAAGRGGEARQDGAFVWADNHTDGNDNTLIFGSNVSGGTVSGANSFNVRSTGGARFVTEADSNGKPTAGVEVAAGDGSWSSLSDAAAKSNVSPVDPQSALDGVDSLSISEWSYESREDITHMGPMAGEFHEAFGLGASDKHITNVDADGVAFAAIQGLSKKLDETLEAKDERIDELEAELDEMRAEVERRDNRIDELGERLTALEADDTSEPATADD